MSKIGYYHGFEPSTHFASIEFGVKNPDGWYDHDRAERIFDDCEKVNLGGRIYPWAHFATLNYRHHYEVCGYEIDQPAYKVLAGPFATAAEAQAVAAEMFENLGEELEDIVAA